MAHLLPHMITQNSSKLMIIFLFTLIFSSICSGLTVTKYEYLQQNVVNEKLLVYGTFDVWGDTDVNGKMTLFDGSMLIIDTYSLLTVSKRLDIQGGTLLVLGGLVNDYHDSYILFDTKRTTGAFTDVYLPYLNNGLTWDTSTLYDDGMIRVIPEPSVELLIVINVFICLGFRRIFHYDRD